MAVILCGGGSGSGSGDPGSGVASSGSAVAEGLLGDCPKEAQQLFVSRLLPLEIWQPYHTVTFSL